MNLLSFGIFVCLLYSLTHSANTESSTVACEKPENNEKPCIKDGSRGICVFKQCLITLEHAARKVLLKVRYNSTNSYITSKYKSFTMWIRGNSMGLNWAKGEMLKKSGDDTWQYLITFNITSTPLKSEDKQAAKLEFRLYLNDEKDMLGANFFIGLPLSMRTDHQGDLRGIPITSVYPWFFSEIGKVTKRIIYSPQLQQKRNITMYTPPSFYENQYKPYKTLYFNDGQRVGFLIPQVDLLIVRSAYIKEIVIVGVVNTFKERVDLLAPTNGSLIECRVGNNSNSCGNCIKCTRQNCSYAQLIIDYRCYKWINLSDPKGQRYLDFIQNTLIPEMQKSYRALPGPENVGIMGFSFGGLVSCHAMWTRPGTFGSAACMSPSLWWPFPGEINATFPDATKYEFVRSTLREHRGARARQKVYIDVGSEEGAVMVDPARNATRILDESPYFELNKNLWFYIWPDEDHNFQVSLKRIWVALLALYGAEGSPNASSPPNASSQRPTGNTLYGYVLVVMPLLFISFLI